MFGLSPLMRYECGSCWAGLSTLALQCCHLSIVRQYNISNTSCYYISFISNLPSSNLFRCFPFLTCFAVVCVLSHLD